MDKKDNFDFFKSSFSFELATLNKVENFSKKQQGFDIIKYNGTYFDPIKNKVRQYDILYENNLCFNRDLKNKTNINLSIVYSLECKEAQSEINVLAMEEDDLNISSRLFKFNNLRAKQAAITDSKSIKISNIPSIEQSQKKVFIGQKIGSVDSKGKVNDNEIYEKYSQCVNTLGAHHQNYLDCNDYILRLFLYVPIIVIPKNMLKVIHFTHEGKEIKVDSIQSVPVKIDFRFENQLYLPYFEIVCIDYLEEKFKQISSNIYDFSQTLYKALADNSD